MLIKSKEDEVKAGLSKINSDIAGQDLKSKEECLIKVSDSIRQILDFKRVNTMFIKDLVQTLNDRQRGVFKSNSKPSVFANHL